MTLDELNEAKAIANRRDWLLKHANYVEWAPVGVDTIFGTSIAMDDVEDILRRGVAAECRRLVAAGEASLRELGVVFPEPVAPPRPTSSWDPETGEFTFVVASTKPTLTERAIGPFCTLPIEEVLTVETLSNRWDLAEVIAGRGRGRVVIGGVIRIWEEGGAILGRARLSPQASAARAAVGNGDVRTLNVGYRVTYERIDERPGQRPLATVLPWELHRVSLDAPDVAVLEVLDPLPPRDAVEAA